MAPWKGILSLLATETFTCRRCDGDWEGEKKRGQVPYYCPPCRPLAIKERNQRNHAKWATGSRERIRELARARYAANPERHRDYQLKTHYGISLSQYGQILAAQGGGCALCGTAECQTGRRLPVDHCHETGRVRGILCHSCNSTLIPGYEKLPTELRDSARLNEYLERDPLLVGD